MKSASKHDCFTIVETDTKEFVIVFGDKRISSKNFKTLKAAKEYCDKKPWELIVNTSFAIYQYAKKIENNEEN